ncbi:MAG: hypothetical protein D6698_06455 [Gammaproteobacteria bacterium]|nr:MAG: hypothetical protein D6698_06455 [Gammaproteobacteria bacterium]
MLPLSDSERQAVLDRPVIQAKQPSRTYWARRDYFDPALDFLDYQNNTGSRSKIRRWSSLRLGSQQPLRWKGTALRFWLEQGEQVISRPDPPKHLSPEYQAGEIRFHWRPRWRGQSFPDDALEVGYLGHRTRSETVTQLKQGGVTLTAAPGTALFRSSARDRGWLLAVRHRSTLSCDWVLYFGAEYRDMTIESRTLSHDRLVTALLAAQQIPQSTPWKEKQVVLNLSADWSIRPTWQIAFDLEHFHINRHDYLPRKGFVDYDHNMTLDGYLFWSPNHSWRFFVQGHASQHFVLGDKPFLYNRRNNHTFRHPFGLLSFGVQYQG